jgi:predicted helicase
MTALQDLLATFRATAKTEREKGNYFERLVKVYLLNEPLYRDMFGGKVYSGKYKTNEERKAARRASAARYRAKKLGAV